MGGEEPSERSVETAALPQKRTLAWHRYSLVMLGENLGVSEHDERYSEAKTTTNPRMIRNEWWGKLHSHGQV